MSYRSYGVSRPVECIFRLHENVLQSTDRRRRQSLEGICSIQYFKRVCQWIDNSRTSYLIKTINFPSKLQFLSAWHLSERHNRSSDVRNVASQRQNLQKNELSFVCYYDITLYDFNYIRAISHRLDWLSGDSFTQLRQIYIEFQRSTRPVKWSYPSALICGSSKEKPLKFYVDSALDVMYYYERLHRHVEKTFSAITLVDSDSMAAYTKTLTYSEQFEQLLADLLLYGSVLTANVFSIDEKSRKI